MHEQCGAISMEVVGHATPSTNEHGGRRIGSDMDENALLRLAIRCCAGARFGNPWDLKPARLIESGLPEIDFMSRLAKRQFAECAQIGALEKTSKRLLHHFWFVNRPPLHEVLRADVPGDC